ncbi:hypothetical protein B0O80DRAFT_439893 [Mortierella sp. GBAus27b]|nr:hypothetical protein BGX31_010147 [Mortierella sp. GBA43]KAI8359275.1 hypothetical protein B0O80DRAFT_439893 [Mortierella sp. GBAus27b]
MQDENAIEAQHSPRFKATTPIKNKPEGSAEGMPPHKTQKITHVPSTQLLETTPLNHITNLPKAYSRTHPSPGKGKQIQEHKPLSRSQTIGGSERSSFQTRLDFHPKATHQPQSPVEYEDDSVIESDREALNALGVKLQEMKDRVNQLMKQCKQEEAHLSRAQSTFQKEKDGVAEQIREAEMELENLRSATDNQTTTIRSLESDVNDWEAQIEAKELEIERMTQEKERFGEQTSRELMTGLEEEVDGFIDLVSSVQDESKSMERQLENTGNIERMIKSEETEDLHQVLREQEIFIKDLEETLEEGELDFEASLGASIEVEFAALRNKCNLRKGSALDKEVTKCQIRLQNKFGRHYKSLEDEYNVKIEQLKMRTQSHEDRLKRLRQNIDHANSIIRNSEVACNETKAERLMIQAEAETLTRQIEEVRQQLAHL